MRLNDFSLRKTKEIEAVHNGRVFFTKNFAFKCLKTGKGSTKFAILVSTKVHKSAVKRNRARRVAREYLQTQYKSLKSGFDCLVILNKNIFDQKGNLKTDELRDSITFTLKKTGLYV